MSRDLSPTSIEAFDCSRLKIAIVQSSYHTDITDKLKNAAIESLKKHGVLDIQELLVPGAFELIYGTQKLLHSQSGIDGIVTLGCVIKGDTDHDIYINQAVASGLVALQHQYHIPIGFGLLTTNNLEQAQDRSGGKHGNKGEEVALAVLQVISCQPKIII
jgi:6,7-dimethyl-8-ribityllumazine synthase